VTLLVDSKRVCVASESIESKMAYLDTAVKNAIMTTLDDANAGCISHDQEAESFMPTTNNPHTQ
jgi:hypothetical protein